MRNVVERISFILTTEPTCEKYDATKSELAQSTTLTPSDCPWFASFT